MSDIAETEFVAGARVLAVLRPRAIPPERSRRRSDSGLPPLLDPTADPYRLLDGTLVANDWNDLTSGAIANAINVSESGSIIGALRSIVTVVGINQMQLLMLMMMNGYKILFIQMNFHVIYYLIVHVYVNIILMQINLMIFVHLMIVQ